MSPTTTYPPTPARPRTPRHRPVRKRVPLKRLLLLLLLVIAVVLLICRFTGGREALGPDWVDVQLIHESSGGRPGRELGRVKDIAIHYVGNPGTTAQQNHDFFDQPETQVSAHFLVGLDGEVIQCLPLDEMSYATNDRNGDTISIEVCHPEADGKFTPETYASLLRLTAWLCDNFDLSRDHVIRHYDVTGKLCPLYFVEHPEAWEQFLADLNAYYEG